LVALVVVALVVIAFELLVIIMGCKSRGLDGSSEMDAVKKDSRAVNVNVEMRDVEETGGGDEQQQGLLADEVTMPETEQQGPDLQQK
jgi:hypothetical protein